MKTANAVNPTYWLEAQRKADGTFWPTWRGRFQFIDGSRTMLNTGAVICPRCLSAAAMPGGTRAEKVARAQVLELCKVKSCRELAARICDGKLSANTQEWQRRQIDGVPAPVVEERAAATMGDLLDCYMANWKLALDSESAAKRNALCMVRVLAYAHGLWKVKEPLVGPRNLRVGERYPDEERIRKLRVSEALTRDTARAYFVNRCAEEELPVSWARNAAQEEYHTINSVLLQARCLFTKRAMQHVYDGRLELPSIAEWKEFTLLPSLSAEPEPLTDEEFARLVAAAEELRDSEPKLWLCNLVARQTGLRCGSLKQLQSSWLERWGDGWRLVVGRDKGDLKKGVATFALPVADRVAAEIAKCDGFVFGATLEERTALVYEAHNALVKRVVGEPKRGHQGAHRLRDTLAGALHGILGKAAAQAALGHGSEKAMDHYSRVPFAASDLMRAEYAAWLK